MDNKQTAGIEIPLYPRITYQEKEQLIEYGKHQLLEQLRPMLTSGDLVAIRVRQERIRGEGLTQPPCIRLYAEITAVEERHLEPLPQFWPEALAMAPTRRLFKELWYRLRFHLSWWSRRNWLTRRARQVDWEKRTFKA